MKYRVIVQPLALEDLDAAFQWAARHAPQAAARWFFRFWDALQTLDTNPERCAVAPESDAVEAEIRQYLFSRKPNVFRALFTIDGDTVRVLHIRRASRRIMTSEELRDPV
jgi:plasmid stabilization system protein ParE